MQKIARSSSYMSEYSEPNLAKAQSPATIRAYVSVPYTTLSYSYTVWIPVIIQQFGRFATYTACSIGIWPAC